MKRIKKGKRLLAVALSMLLAFGGLPTAALAEGHPVQATQGLCEHHLEHTAECGYGEGQPCEHEHTEDCYTDELICGYKVNGGEADREGGLDRDEEAETTASDSDAEHTHTQECYALDCPHERGEHDADCGYAEAQPCGYTCELCGKTDNEPEPKPGEETETEQAACTLTQDCTLADGHEGECVTEPGEGEKEIVCTLTEGCTLPDGHEGECVTELPPANDALAKIITSWTFVATDDSDYTGNEFAMPGVSMERQADFDTVVSMLPTGISAELEGEAEPVPVDVAGWSCQEYVQDENGNWPVTGEYVFTAKLSENYACDPLPTVKVLLGGAELYSQTITGPGYSFDPDSGKLTVSSNAGTTEWRKNPSLPNKEIVTKLEITDAVTAIGEGAFRESGIESVTIPNSVTAIGVRVFGGCTSLTSIHIPNSVTTIGASAFEGCAKLTSVTLAEGLKAGIGAYAFRDCTSLASIHIPNSVTAIGAYAFLGCTKLTSVTLAEGLKAGIGASAFRDCTSLTSIHIPNSVTAIGADAFQSCTRLTSVTLAEGLKAGIGESAFQGCTSLTSINIPGSVTAIGGGAFRGCTKLTSVTLAEGLKAGIGASAFRDCTSLTSIHIPNSVTAIGASAFEGCAKLTSVTLAEGLKAGIEASAFEDCASLASINIPGSVTAIGAYAFRGCTKLTSVTLAEGLKVGIGAYAFWDCTSLTSIHIPNSVTAIGEWVFRGCTKLANITFEHNSAPSIGSYPFDDTSADLVIHVPAGATDYNGTNWPTDKIVEGSALPLTNLTISGGTITPVFRMGTQTYTATVPATVTSVTVTPSAKGTITVNGQTVASGASSEAIMLEAGKDNEIKIVVKSDETLSRAYTVTVTREPLIVTDIKEILGVSVPVLGNTPVTTITETSQYTGTVSWNPNDSTFAADTNYTATITLTPKAGYTLQGVAENFFTVDGAAPVTNAVNSGEITAVFPKTDKAPIDLKGIEGIAAPVRGNTPVTTITETMQYTGTVSWNPNDSTFAADTNYTATITLTPKAGYTLQGVAENFFTVDGAAPVTNAVNSGEITAVFPKTDKAPIDLKGIEGIAAPVRGNTPVTTITETMQYTGTVSWNPNDSTFAADTNYTATITLTPKAGYTLQGVAENFFTVDGAAPVTNAVNSGEITAVFPKTDKQVYTVTVETSGNGTASTSSINAAEGETVILSATADRGYHFKEWQVISGGITITNNQFLMPAGDVTVRAVFEKDSSGSSGGGGSSSSGGGGSSSSNNSTVTTPKDSYTSTGTQIGQSVSRSDLQRLANAGKSLTIQSGTAAMTFDPAALKAILAAVPATAGNITFAAVPEDISAFPDAAALIGTRPAYSFTISYKDSKGSAIPVNVNFPTGSASISLNYAPAEGEVTGSLFMVYVDGKGAVTWLDKSSYDNGKVLAEVPHFSVYGVAYKAPVPVFTDIANHWAKADMEFVAARGLLSGTGNNLFSPDGAMTRGMFVTALGRLAGVGPASYQTRSFTDVKADAYYAAYVEWAAQKNIVKGTGEGLFSPDAPVTREQMAVMMTNYANATGYSIPTPLAAVTFADNANISAWAAKEVAAMQRAGIIKGKDGNRFDPQVSATRAEVSAVLRRFVEIVIDPVTAQGWGKNDSGQWLYYKDGKALTGWKQIGSKWYYFDKNGIMAVNTKVNGYEIGPDGARKENH